MTSIDTELININGSELTQGGIAIIIDPKELPITCTEQWQIDGGINRINNIREVLFQKSHEYYIDFIVAILGVRLHLSFCNHEKKSSSTTPTEN